MSAELLLIGVDGGATEVKAHAARCDDLAAARVFELRPETASRVYPRVDTFTPVPVAEQLAQRESGRLALTDHERQQGRLWIEATAEAIADVARQAEAQRVLVGVGMPGLKTPDARGINAINNGPRMPEYLAQVEALLAEHGLTLAAPIAALGSDADYCGLGEEYAADGLFRDVENAYYFGGGTGIADAMKLRGQLVPFDRAKPWIQKSWQMASTLGPTFEKLVSAGSLNRVFRGLRLAARNTADEFPERAATRRGDAAAKAWLHTVALVLAELLFERLDTIRNGRAEVPDRGPAYLALEREHPYRGTALERVIIGQRIGQIFAATEHAAVFRTPLEHCLAALLAASGDAEFRQHYLGGRSGELRPGLLVASRLRAAPALGAAVAAVRASKTP